MKTGFYNLKKLNEEQLRFFTDAVELAYDSKFKY